MLSKENVHLVGLGQIKHIMTRGKYHYPFALLSPSPNTTITSKNLTSEWSLEGLPNPCLKALLIRIHL